MRARFLKEGLDHFDAHNVLELLLAYAIPRRDTNELAHHLIRRFGSLAGVFDASHEELQKVDGIGSRAATLIKMMPDICRRYYSEKNATDDLLNSTDKLGNYLLPAFIGRTNEIVYLLCLDNKHKPLYGDILVEGTIDSAPIFIRNIAETALRVGAAAVVLAHNHPQGFAIPSANDVDVTIKVAKALEAVSVRLIDHIIVAKDDYVSLADSGILLRQK